MVEARAAAEAKEAEAEVAVVVCRREGREAIGDRRQEGSRWLDCFKGRRTLLGREDGTRVDGDKEEAAATAAKRCRDASIS